MTVEEALAIAKTTLNHKRFNKVQELVFRESWQGHSYEQIAETSGYGMGYIKDAGSKLWQLLSEAFGEKVTKNNLHSVLKRYVQRTRVVAAISQTSRLSADVQLNGQNPKTNELKGVPSFWDTLGKPDSLASFAATLNEDWGDAVDVSVFYGRTAELIELKQWIVRERCRLVMVLGIGGIGKTVLSIKLAEQIQEHFDYVIWRSLRNAPLIQDLLPDLIQFLSNQQETEIPGSVDGKISRLLKYLRSSRCLLVLDNIESILHWGTRMGGYSEGCEGYGELFRRLGEERHNSCLILASREKPKELAALEGEVLPVRSFQLTGLPVIEGQKIFQLRGNFYGSETEWKFLIEHYAGNPLVLKMIVPAIRDFFESKVSNFLEFLEQGTFVFDDIRNLLDQQFNRLSNLEKMVMHWLAINREPTSFLELQKDLLPKVSEIELLETLASLQRRSLIEKSSAGFTQQPFVMEYMIEQLDRTANSINLPKDCYH